MPGKTSVMSGEVLEGEDDPLLALVQALGAIGMMIAMMGLMFCPYALLRMYDGAIPGEYKRSVYTIFSHHVIDDSFWLTVSGGIEALLFAGLLIGSFGCLYLKKWGRIILLMWSAAALAIFIPTSYFYVRWIAPPWRDDLAQVRTAIATYVSILSWAIGIGEAVTFLIVLNIPRVRAFFSGQSIPNPSE